MRMQSPIVRRKSRQIMVGKVPVGGDAPIAVQSMTNTETCDVEATLAQIRRLEAVGADIVRVSVPTMEAAEAFRKIRAATKVPLVADIHFDYDQSSLTEEARATLEKHALWLQNHREAKVLVEGHCDERGTVEYNLALGNQRAQVTRDYLASLGVAASSAPSAGLQ